ncbi:MAG TPA: DUF4388 domain-containing protein [Caldisericia bacterium]|nr:DUF4388 domain-containing protein [Caldisericia bacterium]HQL66884.1 DUF4388 domain-containing protein [Caldisericia bacterium]HQN48881.1 DUF4388 domain-containing protein [Caldisericia bacterium]HQO99540.1 DUF4388 domain-containing protein [Caldisericia bacterium]
MELTGNLKDFTIEDLLKFINLSKRTGVIYIKGNVEKEGEKEGIIFCKDGNIIDAELGDRSGENAFYVVLTMKEGTFNFSKELPKDKTVKINKQLEELLFEGAKQVEIIDDVLKKLPSLDTIFRVNPTPPSAKISLNKDEWMILNKFRDGKTIREVKNEVNLNEIDVLRTILSLINANLIVREEVDIMKIVPEHSDKAKSIIKTYSGLDISLFPTNNVRANNFFFKVDGKKDLETIMNEMKLKRKDALSLFMLLIKEGALKVRISPSLFNKIEEELKK